MSELQKKVLKFNDKKHFVEGLTPIGTHDIRALVDKKPLYKIVGCLHNPRKCFTEGLYSFFFGALTKC